MYGGHVIVPANSPHLRKSGSRTVVSDLGTSDLGNSSEENLLHLVESNEIKGVTTPLTRAAIMPSPILLWRLKAHLVLAAAGIAASFGIDQTEMTRIQKIPDCLAKKISAVVYTSSQIVLCLTA